MSVKERDPLTGYETTGHEWDGIKELNTGVPKIVWRAIGVTFVYSAISWVLLPAWPLVTTYTGGLLGIDQQATVNAELVAEEEARAPLNERIVSMSAEEILSDDELRPRVLETAHVLFADNCSVCHGADANGGPGFPSLVDKAWLWGGDEDTIMETLRVGINAPHEETRVGQMLAFGREGMLERDQIRQVVSYVRSLSGHEGEAESIAAGQELFAENCASCHGDEGKGSHDVGAPDLTDEFWIYGGDEESLFTTIYGGRQGWMPAWETRLSEARRKILTVYLLDKAQ